MICYFFPGDVNRKFRLSNRSNSIETNRTDWSNRSNSIEVIDRTIEVNRIFTCFFRLIGFDWLRLIRSISSIGFDWVRSIRSISSIDSIDQFDWFDQSVRLILIEFNWFDNRNFRLSSIKFSFFVLEDLSPNDNAGIVSFLYPYRLPLRQPSLALFSVAGVIRAGVRDLSEGRAKKNIEKHWAVA